MDILYKGVSPWDSLYKKILQRDLKSSGLLQARERFNKARSLDTWLSP